MDAGWFIAIEAVVILYLIVDLRHTNRKIDYIWALLAAAIEEENK